MAGLRYNKRCVYELIVKSILMLLTDVGDEMCWWQLWVVGDGFGPFLHHHSLSFNIGFLHQHPEDDTNIEKLSPTYNDQHRLATNSGSSLTSMSPVIKNTPFVCFYSELKMMALLVRMVVLDLQWSYIMVTLSNWFLYLTLISCGWMNLELRTINRQLYKNQDIFKIWS